MTRTTTEEVIWLSEFEILVEAPVKIGRRMEMDHKMRYVESSLGYVSTEGFVVSYIRKILKCVV